MSNKQAEIYRIRVWIREGIGKISDEYWEAYFRQLEKTKANGEVFTWRAGCRIRETQYGARLQWFYIQPVEQGKNAYYRPLIDNNARSSARYIKRMRDLQPAERAAVMSVKSVAAPLENLGKRIERYDRIGRAVIGSAWAMGWRP